MSLFEFVTVMVSMILALCLGQLLRSASFLAYVFFMWFDGPLFTEQAVFGKVGILHIPIIAATLVPGMSENDRANSVAASAVIAVLLVVIAVRYSTA